MNIKEKFIELTTRTYPHGTEEEMFHLLDGLHKDDFGNLFIKIGIKLEKKLNYQYLNI